jgi:hypothetical protein
MLKFDWFAEAPIDFEHKNYVLLSYLKEIDEAYSYHKLSPYLLYTEKLVQDMKFFQDNEWRFTNSLWTPIVSFNLQTGIRRREVQKGEEMKEIIEIVHYSIPLLESKVNLGWKLLERYPQVLF